MSFVSGIDEARWTVLLDIRWPHSYLALHPTAALGQELGVEINWLPHRVPPLRRPSEPSPDDDRGIRHRRYRAQAIAREIDTYSRIQGLVLRDWYRAPDTGALELAWLWIRAQRPERLDEFLAEAFRAYWALELDPASETAVAALIDGSVGDGAAFARWRAQAGRESARGLEAELRERGLGGDPCHLVEDEVFLGRQHLPMIRWILQGRNGPGPI
jgi:2-hydroxychromene-2-carboxylate isomerase